MRVQRTSGDSRAGGQRAGRACWMTAATAALVLSGGAAGCGKGVSPAAPGDAGADARGDAPLAACPASDAGAAGGVGDDFGPNARAPATSSALGQLNVYEVTSPRQLEWIDLYLRAELGGTQLTISIYEAAARNAVFRRLTMVQLEVPPCDGWVASGPVGLPLAPGRFYAIGYDPNQAVTAYVDSEANNLPVDGHFGRLIGARTSTSVSLDTLDWGKLSDKDFTRQRIFTSPRADAASDGAVDGASDTGATGSDGGGADRGPASDAPVGDASIPADARG